jgi:hypothetical protein
MRKILFASILILTFCFAAFGQDSPFPKIEISVPQGIFVEGYEFAFTANVGDYNGRLLTVK